MTQALELADASKIRRKGWKLFATTIVDDDETKAILSSITPAVYAHAARTIWHHYNYWRRRQVWVFDSRLYPIRRNVLVRRLQLAVRRRAFRLKLVAWERRLLWKLYMHKWWATALSRDSFLFSLRRAAAKQRVVEAGEKAGVFGLTLGDTALPKETQAYFVTMRSTLAMMEQFLHKQQTQKQAHQQGKGLGLEQELGDGNSKEGVDLTATG